MSTPKELYLNFIKKQKVAKDTYSFYFNSKRENFSFLPGQYIRMTLDIRNSDNRGNLRSFTIASSPLEKNHLMITTKIVQSSFKRRLADLVVGESVKFYGPLGGFVLDEQEKTPRVFLAGGIGITPFHSMITYAFAKKILVPITLIVSFSSIEEMVFYEEVSKISKESPYIKTIYTITHPDSNWKGEEGRISEYLIKKYVQDVLEPRYFIVGPPAMVAAIEDVVRNMGVTNEKIFIENFTGY